MLRAGDGIVICVLGLLCIGVVMVNSAGLTIDPAEAVTFQSIVWSRQTLYMMLAVAVMILTARLPLDRLSRSPGLMRLTPMIIPVLVGVLLLVYMPGLRHEVNGSKRWLRLPGDLTMQPSELAKWGLVLVLAWHGARKAAVMHRFASGLLPGLLIVGPIAALIAKEDLGTGVLIAAGGCLMLVAAGARVRQLAAFVPLGVVGVAALVVTSPYRVQRLTSFLDPYADPDGAGYHMIQSLVAVSNGQGFGRGLGFGLQKFGYLPEDKTDFLFAVICEELGLAGASIVVALYIGLLWAGVAIVRRQSDPFLKLVGLGITATFGLQALINLAVVTGLAPTKGIALPLLSSGGTGWIMTAGSLGLLVAMDRVSRAKEMGVPAGGSATGPASVVPEPARAIAA